MTEPHIAESAIRRQQAVPSPSAQGGTPAEPPPVVIDTNASRRQVRSSDPAQAALGRRPASPQLIPCRSQDTGSEGCPLSPVPAVS
jgi:hypothetical protein